jgi:hypothetical protein
MQILPFSQENLLSSLSNKYTEGEVIKNKSHFNYFLNYLGSDGLKSKTILVEEPYVSKDFIDDYTYYYATCHEDYSKFCKRIHFFDISFDESEFKKELLDKESTSDFWNSYLGFIVVKPIPTTIIGFTVLKTYSESNSFNERNFWGIRDYKIHLYGKVLTIKSLAFQEQDSVLAACATTAIWSMLNKASIDFHTILKSPGQITKDAGDMASDGSRLFPNSGLNLLQICQAIYNSGLVSEIKQDNYVLNGSDGSPIFRIVSNEYTKKIINAYSSIGIPLILVIYVPNGGIHGLHAITISGFLQKEPIIEPSKQEISWLSSNIEKIYTHDDQHGPFARVTFNDVCEIDTPWSHTTASYQPTYVSSIVVPLYPKIRISYENIESIVLGIDRILYFFFNGKINANLVWDIKIDFSENFKGKIIDSTLDEITKIDILKKSLPKYLWVASCYVGNEKILDFTFDATNVKNAMIGVEIICFLDLASRRILVDYLIQNRDTLKNLIPYQIDSYYNFFISNLEF